MTVDLIISYDGTPNDDDALALGRRLAVPGSSLTLAYVRHAREFDPRREELAQYDAEQRLQRGAERIGVPVKQHVVVGAATGDMLGELAAQQGASIVVFGSDYRTPLGRAEPGTSAQRLLDGGSVAVAVAAAGLRARPERPLRSVAVPFAGPVNDDARATAASWALASGGQVVDAGEEDLDLIVVGSREDAPRGRVVVAGEVRTELNSARSSVLVLPAQTRIDF
ncbi:MAG TPA: universal stress protein [Solirubrobacteraceae bacterium]|nr:universal stress protein [Solirubrobacteraceae bacterium]